MRSPISIAPGRCVHQSSRAVHKVPGRCGHQSHRENHSNDSYIYRFRGLAKAPGRCGHQSQRENHKIRVFTLLDLYDQKCTLLNKTQKCATQKCTSHGATKFTKNSHYGGTDCFSFNIVHRSFQGTGNDGFIWRCRA